MDNNKTEVFEQQQGFVQSMLDASMNGILLLEPVFDSAGVLVDFLVRAANRAITNHVEISVKEAVNSRMSQLFPCYKEYGFFNVFITAFGTGQLQRKQLLYKDKCRDGWYEIGVTTNKNMVVVTLANITEQKLYQKKIETSAGQMDAIINTSQSSIFLFAPAFNEVGELTDFRFTKCNPTLASYVGQTADGLVGGLGSEWFPSYKTNGLFELYRDTYVTGKTNRFDFHYYDDKINVWLDILSSKLGDEVLVTFTDFTPTKLLQLELEETVNELKRSNSNLEEFAYVASHDLQEPLRKIQYFSDRLKELCSQQNDTANIVGRLQGATVRMQTLIEDLLSYSKFSFNHTPFTTIDLNQTVKDILGDLDTSVNEKHASVTVQALPVISGDTVQLRQLFQNVVSNALKYNRNNVPLQINISNTIIDGKEVADEIPCSEQNKKFNLIEVSDNGIGFDPLYAKRIFKIFQRLHGRSEYPGTGLGLAIVQKVAANHKGYVFAEGTPGEGATFKILLPV